MPKLLWTQKQDIGPEPRRGHAMAYDPRRKRVVLFGGQAFTVKPNNILESRMLSDTWEWDGANWTQVADPRNGLRPRSADAHTLWRARFRDAKRHVGVGWRVLDAARRFWTTPADPIWDGGRQPAPTHRYLWRGGAGRPACRYLGMGWQRVDPTGRSGAYSEKRTSDGLRYPKREHGATRRRGDHQPLSHRWERHVGVEWLGVDAGFRYGTGIEQPCYGFSR
jgi:hypothetical protein